MAKKGRRFVKRANAYIEYERFNKANETDIVKWTDKNGDVI